MGASDFVGATRWVFRMFGASFAPIVEPCEIHLLFFGASGSVGAYLIFFIIFMGPPFGPSGERERGTSTEVLAKP